MRYKHTKEELEEAVKKTLAIAGVCRELNMKACGGNYKTLHAKIKEWKIDTSHFTGAAWNSLTVLHFLFVMQNQLSHQGNADAIFQPRRLQGLRHQ